MFLLSLSELSGLHCSLQLLLAGSFLCVFTMICNFQSYSPTSRISRGAERWIGHGDFTFSAMIWIRKLSEKRLLFHGCLASEGVLETLGQWWPHIPSSSAVLHHDSMDYMMRLQSNLFKSRKRFPDLECDFRDAPLTENSKRLEMKTS